MVIIFESGQLGNQLFQYCALKKFQKNGALFMMGMQPLKSTFLGVEIAGETGLASFVERLICRLRKDRIDTLARKYRLIGFIEEQITDAGSNIVVSKGLFNNIYCCGKVHFQSENQIENAVTEKLYLKPELLTVASSIFNNFPHDRMQTFFVHVRRRDYIYWPSCTAPAVLPSKWYHDQMDLIRSKFTKPFFVVISDDGPYSDEMFGDLPDVFVSHETEGVDFALMSICEGGGILSASSFAWWGAYFARRINNDAFFVAPLYWAGHRDKVWNPMGIKTSWINYISVS